MDFWEAEMSKINLDGRYPCMADWVILKKTKDGILARNCLIDEEIYLSEDEAIYLKSLNGNRSPYRIEGFTYEECEKLYDQLDDYLMIRKTGRSFSDGTTNIHTLYIPDKKSTRSVIPKILNLLLMTTFLPVFIYGLHLIIEYGIDWGDGDDFLVNIMIGTIFGIIGGLICHEAAHAAACLSCRKGKLLEAGIMVRKVIPGAYVWLDTSDIKSKFKLTQISLAGIEMNILLSGVMMILLVVVKKGSILYGWQPAIFEVLIQNLFMALLNICFVEGLDGEHAISELLGGSVFAAAKANIKQMSDKKKRKEYFAITGINGVANVGISVALLSFKLLIPLFILADIFTFIGDWFV